MMADLRYADEKIVVINVAINDAFVLGVAPTVYTSNPNVLTLTESLYKSYYSSFAVLALANNKYFVIDGPNPITDAGHNALLQAGNGSF